MKQLEHGEHLFRHSTATCTLVSNGQTEQASALPIHRTVVYAIAYTLSICLGMRVSISLWPVSTVMIWK